MDPITGGLIAGGASLLGSMFTSQTNAQNTQAQIAASEQEQATQNAFSTQMSNTAYQRASADMKAAGLNPAMMFGSGSAASTPSPSSIQAPMPQNTSKLGGLGSAVNSGVSTAIQAKTFDKMTEEISNLQADAALTKARENSEKEVPALKRAEVDLTKERSFNTSTDTAARQNEMPESRVKGLSAAAIESMPAWLRDSAARAGYLGRQGNDFMSPFVSSAHAVSRFLKPWSF